VWRGRVGGRRGGFVRAEGAEPGGAVGVGEGLVAGDLFAVGFGVVLFF
jgi:hypothetical protein